MADGSYFESYPNLESTANLIPPIGSYRPPTSSDSYVKPEGEVGAGFYGDPSFPGMGGGGGLSAAALHGAMNGHHPQHPSDYSMGADDVKDMSMHGLQQSGPPPGLPHMTPAEAAALGQHLAKPVPVRRLSEKTISQARSSLCTTSSLSATAESPYSPAPNYGVSANMNNV